MKRETLLLLGCITCGGSTSRIAETTPSAAHNAEARFEIAEMVYDDGLKNGWEDSGTAPRETTVGGSLRVRFDDSAEWALVKHGLTGPFGGITFRVKAPPGEGEFLEVRLESTTKVETKKKKSSRGVKISPDHRKSLDDGWTEILVPMEELNAEGGPFDRVTFRAFRPFGADWVLLDKIALTKQVGPARPSSLGAVGGTATPLFRVACDAKATRISRAIYGFAGGDETGAAGKFLPSAHRWGGNPTTRYNWETHVLNVGQDWFFENHTSAPYTQFLTEDAAHDRLSALTVPMLGWVAKDATSYSFPVSMYGSQEKTDPYRPDAGNGVAPNGRKLPPGSPSRTSVPAPAEWAKRWILSIRAADAKSGKRSVYEYILDNEPMLWHSTHRDVRTEPVGYDELLRRTIEYGTAIRQADPDALIAGPAEWGWPNYFFSAKDMAAGLSVKPDRRAHDDLPLVEWYLRKLREHQQKTGMRVLDVLDLHYYPQEKDVYASGAGATDKETGLLRLRSTRSLWDPSYRDESWIADAIRLLPRMREWVEKDYPGRGISIGEWNFGGESDITGALAIAEALGRFAQFGVQSAFYWTIPSAQSPAIQGFAAFRNFDGKGGRFLDWYLPSVSPASSSMFASRDEEGKHLVLVVINMSPDDSLRARLDLGACGPTTSEQTYVYARGASGFSSAERPQSASDSAQVFPPWSITVVDVRLAHALPGNLDR
jgi:hypothetical protein